MTVYLETTKRIFHVKFGSGVFRASLSRMLPSFLQVKTGGDNINSSLALMTKSGKYVLGTKQTLKSLRSAKGACGTLRMRVSHPSS